MLFQKKSLLDGAWEEPGVKGTRLEIRGRRLLVLWMNQPVLDTTFTVGSPDEEGRLILSLKDTGLRYAPSETAYAEVTALYLKEERLYFEKNFPITGPNIEILTKTERSRYGDYTVCDEVLGQLRGTWKDAEGFFSLTFSGDTLTVQGQKMPVHALHSNTVPSHVREYRIAHQDAGVHGLAGLTDLIYRDGVLSARIPVCDAPSVELTFTRV